ncbi:MAG: hypothetical protein IJ864_00210 [Alphaproteobacteria bacterium]|nr:hypothetical protein [Alphaproteobacteria bacterium]
MPVQAYHYRKITLAKIRDYDIIGQEINAEIKEFLKNVKVPILTCKSFRDYKKIFEFIDKYSS